MWVIKEKYKYIANTDTVIFFSNDYGQTNGYSND